MEFGRVNSIRNDKLLVKFGLHLKKLREEKELSQEALANDSNVPISQVGRIERGEINTTISTLEAIATGLKMKLKDLLDMK